ncbi:MAG: LysM peptidoglycan-binding domain-containing protein [Chloroflexi bacterium]|nr:LysM peptidoglycan-binding domain-containing protein [Chloroflexota bacterium]
MHTPKWTSLLAAGLLLAALIAAAMPAPRPAQAQAGSAYDLIAAVNAYRAANGLDPYDIDNSLMSKAQEQSEYQASIQTCTHQRADGSTAGDHGISAENVACGVNLSVEGAIYGQWSDALHSATMLGPTAGLAGAGVAMSGSTVYYTLDVVRIAGDFTYRPPAQTEQATLAPGQSTYTPIPQMAISGPLVTSTPGADGAIIHVLRYGDTLITVAEAYGITLDELYAANSSLNRDNPVYYEGQQLIIRPANTATPVITPSETPVPPTPTVTPTRTPTRPPTLTPTRTPTRPPLIQVPEIKDIDLDLNLDAIGIGFMLVCAAGLVFVVVNGFRKDQ